MEREGFIEMKVSGLTLDPVTKTPIVILRDSENKLNLPIWIGLMEATSMATELEGIKMARPMTHDLLRNMVDEAGGTVEAVEVTELRDNTYWLSIYERSNGCLSGLVSPPRNLQTHSMKIQWCPTWVSRLLRSVRIPWWVECRWMIEPGIR